MNIESLKNSRDFLEILMDNLDTRIFIVNKKAEVKEFNHSFEDMIGIGRNDLFNNRCGNLLGCSYAVEEDCLCGSTSHCYSCVLRNSIMETFNGENRHNRQMLSRNFYLRGKKLRKHFLSSTKLIKFNDESMTVIILDDVTELQNKKEELLRLSITDELTGIYNRRYTFECLEKEYERYNRYKTNFSLMLLDLDHFKNINDNYGHQTGDEVLKKIALTVKTQIRSIDIFGRYGGEEFLLILPETDKIKTSACAEKVRKSIENIDFTGLCSPVTISIGTATHQNGESTKNLISRADKALYKAKEKGRNRVEVDENR